MQLKRRIAVKPQHKVVPRHNDDPNYEARGLNAAVRFFVDHVISVAVSSVARNQAQTARLAITGSSGSMLHILVSTTGEGENFRFVAYSNDMCLFTGSSPSLYVANQTPRDLEHSIYLYVSEKLAGEGWINVQIFRESSTLFELPVLEGSSNAGPRGLKPRLGMATG